MKSIDISPVKVSNNSVYSFLDLEDIILTSSYNQFIIYDKDFNHKSII